MLSGCICCICVISINPDSIWQLQPIIYMLTDNKKSRPKNWPLRNLICYYLCLSTSVNHPTSDRRKLQLEWLERHHLAPFFETHIIVIRKFRRVIYCAKSLFETFKNHPASILFKKEPVNDSHRENCFLLNSVRELIDIETWLLWPFSYAHTVN